MADKQNTQSILENIRKKIQKFEKPRNVDAKLSTSMGDEFEYISTASDASKTVTDDIKKNSETSSIAPKQSDDHAALEKELEDSFSDFLNKASSDTTTNTVPASSSGNISSVKDDLDFNIFENNTIDNSTVKTEDKTTALSDDHRLDFDVLDKHEIKEEVKTEVKPEVKTEKPKFKPEDNFDIQIDPNKISASTASTVSKPEQFPKKEDDFLSAKIEDNFDAPKIDKNSANLKDVKPVENSNKTLTAQVMENPVSHETNDDFLKIETEEETGKVSNDEMNKLNELSNFLDEKPVNNKPKIEEKAKDLSEDKLEFSFDKPPVNNDIFNVKSADNSSQTLDAVDLMISQKAADQVSSSIKKLVEAKSSASDIASLTKSDKFNDVATQLLEEKLEKWLNDNLPDLVEKIVREEIKKIVH